MSRIIILLALITLILTCYATSPLQGSLYMPVLDPDEEIILLAQAEEGNEEAPEGDEQESFPGEQQEELFQSEKLRDLKTSFLLSLVVPGAGEFYAGNYIKAGTFFALEAGMWTGYFVFNKKGDDGIEEYEAFVDDHWDFEYYYNWFAYEIDSADIYTEQLPVDTVDITIDTVSGDTTYVFEPNKNHDYYEMIGKYDWFVLGWNDFENRDAVRDSTLDVPRTQLDILNVLRGGQANAFFRSEWRNQYMVMRKEANDQYTTAKYFIGAAIMNHILSAFDAAWTAKRSNDRIYEGFTFQPTLETNIALDSRGNPEPRLVLNLATF